MKKGLSKSKYTKFCQCPKALWLSIYKPEEAIEDAGAQARFEQGNEVGDLAMGLFGDYVEVTTQNADGSLNLNAMIEKTKEEVTRETAVICEASFSFEKNYCAVDLLRKTKDGWSIYEVKSCSNSKEENYKKYAFDIAYQKWVLTQCGINVTGTHLVCLNSAYVRQGELNLQNLFTIVDMQEQVENEYQKVPASVSQALKIVNSEQEPDDDLSESCNTPYDCAFFEYCKRQHGVPQDEATVFDLYRMNFTKKLKHYLSRCR